MSDLLTIHFAAKLPEWEISQTDVRN